MGCGCAGAKYQYCPEHVDPRRLHDHSNVSMQRRYCRCGSVWPRLPSDSICFRHQRRLSKSRLPAGPDASRLGARQGPSQYTHFGQSNSMIDLTTMKLGSRRALSSVLGLSLEGSRLEGAVLRRNNGSLQVQQTFAVTLSLDPLTADAELAGREIKNHLDAAEVRERHCVVSLPLKWALTTHVDIPEMPEEAIAEFLQIEAERGFHADIETLYFATSRIRLASGKRQAFLAAVPHSHLQTLGTVLAAAKLKPISFVLGVPALEPPAADKPSGTAALAIAETHIALEITGGGGLAALRALEGTLETEGGKKRLHA